MVFVCSAAELALAIPAATTARLASTKPAHTKTTDRLERRPMTFLPLTGPRGVPATAVSVLPHKLVQRQRDVNGPQAFGEPKCGVALPKWTGPRAVLTNACG